MRRSELISRTGAPMKRCICMENACGDDWPAAARPETDVSRCEARILRSQRLTRQKLSSDVRRINQPERKKKYKVSQEKKERKNGTVPMVMRKNDNQYVVASFATAMSSMVAPGIVPDGIPLTMVMFNFR